MGNLFRGYHAGHKCKPLKKAFRIMQRKALFVIQIKLYDPTIRETKNLQHASLSNQQGRTKEACKQN